MKKTFVLIAFALVSPLASFPQVNGSVPAEPVFRSPFDLKLRVDKDHYYEQKFNRVPYVVDGDVYLFVGEDFGINVTVTGDRLSGVTYQPDAAKADVEFKLTQEKAPDGFMMLLVIKNRLKRKLFFDALMTVPEKTGIFKTRVLPVEPNLSNYESWAHPIVQLVLRNFRFSENESQ